MTSFASFWAGALALLIALYVVLDGFDLGVGILFGLTSDESQRRSMAWCDQPDVGRERDVAGHGRCELLRRIPAGLRVTHVSVLSSRHLHAGRVDPARDRFRVQGEDATPTAGYGMRGLSPLAARHVHAGHHGRALVYGLPVSGGQYVGGPTGWLSPFSLLCGLGLVLGYALLGATWLARKTEGAVLEAAYRQCHSSSLPALLFWSWRFTYALASHLRVVTDGSPIPNCCCCPHAGHCPRGLLIRAVRQRNDGPQFPLAALGFLSAFATLAASFWPFMIPFSVTVRTRRRRRRACPSCSGARDHRVPAYACLHRHQFPDVSR